MNESPSSMWHNRDYVRLLVAQVISLVGTGMSSVCLALFAYDLAGEEAGMVLSIAFAIKMLAYIGLAPVFALLVNRLPKQRTLVFFDLFRALLFVCLPFVTQVWQVYLLMFLINACSAGFTPLYQSILPSVLPDKNEYAKALSFSRMNYDLEQIFSPMLTALLLTMVGFRELFMVDAATFVLSGVLILLCTLPNLRHVAVAKQPKKGKLSHGVKEYLRKPQLRSLWFAYLAAASASAMVLVNTVIYVHEVLHGDDTQTALAMMLVGVGSIMIALRLPKLVEVFSVERFHWIGFMTICGAFSLGVFTPGWVGFVLICLAMGVGMSCIQTSAGLVITNVCGNEDTAPYFSAHFSLTHFWWLITYLVAGTSVKIWGLSGGYLVMGLVSLIGVVLYWRASKSHCLV